LQCNGNDGDDYGDGGCAVRLILDGISGHNNSCAIIVVVVVVAAVAAVAADVANPDIALLCSSRGAVIRACNAW
jgi:hypothetical protein